MKRLDAAIELIPNGCILADIGCDHGRLGLECLKSGKASKVYACDVSAPSLQKAVKALDGYSAECIVSDGFDRVPHDFTAAAICGMGCRTMLEILSRYDGDATLILQPQTEPHELRKAMLEKGYKLEREISAYERRRYYSVMRFVKGEWNPTELEIAFGLNALSGGDEILIKHCERLIEEFTSYPDSQKARRTVELARQIITVKK